MIAARRLRRLGSRHGDRHPLIIGLSLIWLIGRGVPWNAKLMTVVVTLAIIVLIALLERGGYWPASWRRS